MKPPSRILPHVLKRVLPATTIVLVMVWLTWRMFAAEVIRREVSGRIESQAAQAAAGIADRLDHLRYRVQDLAANDLVVNGLIDTVGRGGYLPTFFRSLSIEGPHEERVTLTDYNGRPVASNLPNPKDFGRAPWFQKVMKGDEWFEISSESIEIAFPVLYAGLPEGVVVMQYGAEDVCKILGMSAGNALFRVLDPSGSTVYSSAIPFGECSGDGPPFQGDIEDWVETRVPVPGYPGLRLSCAESAEDALAPMRRVEAFFLAAVALNMLALAAAVFWSVRMVSDPLSNLVRELDEITEFSDLNKRVPETGPAEFQRLSRSFNRLLEHLGAATERLHASERTARAILDASPAAIVLLDREGTVLDCNEGYGSFLGQDLQNLKGRRFWNVIPEEYRHQRKKEILRVFDTREPVRGEQQWNEKWNEFYVEPVHRETEGEIQSVIVEVFDVTARKELEERVHAADELRAMEAGRAQMSGMVLHQMGNALTPAAISLEQMQGLNRTDHLEWLRRCAEALNRHRDDLGRFVQVDSRGKRILPYMEELIDALRRQAEERRKTTNAAALAVSRISETLTVLQSYSDDTGRERELMNLNVLLEDALKIQSFAFESLGIQVKREMDPDIPGILLDKSRMMGVVNNLLRNSCAAIESANGACKERQIRVQTFRAEAMVGFTVEDTGCGIEPNRLASLFDAEAYRKGTFGFGLYHCRQVVKANGGRLSVTSQGKGTGATVRALFEI
jgi:PAS domain S-box-containing protein